MWGTGGPRGFTVPAQTRPRVRKTTQAQRDVGSATAWTKVAVILSVIAAALNLGSAALHALPTSPSSKVVVVTRVNRVAGRAGQRQAIQIVPTTCPVGRSNTVLHSHSRYNRRMR
jgi:hypothetical protein